MCLASVTCKKKKTVRDICPEDFPLPLACFFISNVNLKQRQMPDVGADSSVSTVAVDPGSV